MSARNVVITGASLGIGRAIAEAFVNAGDHVLLCARTPGPLEQAARELARPGQKVLFQSCDVSDETQVAALAAFTVRELGGCDVLINNASVQGPIGPLDEVAWAEWRSTVEIGLFGVALPCRAFIPRMKRRGAGKIINLSGGGATSARPGFSAYAAAKTAVVRLTETLAAELRPFRIDVNAVAPGALNTRLLDEVIEAGPEKVGADFYQKSVKQAKEGGVPLELGADLCVYLASDESDGITGKLISAKWDPWARLQDYKAELQSSDIYALRRITPEDRGKHWDL